MFRDEAKIQVRGGDGGDGCVSFCQEKYQPKGGPDGGKGGRGGHVIFTVQEHKATLLDLVRNPHQFAENGRPGGGNNRSGRRGEDLVLMVPRGTIVKDQKSGEVIGDLSEEGATLRVARGGRGGRGNSSFKSATHQTPREFEQGTEGQIRNLLLELKLIADVGLVGLPNAGKSTLISRISSAHPKVADYPFTTIQPHPGIVELSGFRRMVMMDIPGLVEGAHKGLGLGDRFLRHVERTRVLVHLIDLCPPEGCPTPEEAHAIIEAELVEAGRGLADKPRLLIFSKTDLLPDATERVAELSEKLGREAYGISAASGAGIERFKEDCWRLLHGDRTD